jgi:hypothetical protein
MATRILTKQSIQSDLNQIVKGVNKIVKEAGRKELEHELGENFDPNKKDRKSVVSLVSTLFEHKPYATQVPKGFVDMQRRLGSQDSKNLSTSKNPEWQQRLDEQKKLLKKIRGGMNRKSKKKRRNKKKKRYTRRRVR